MSVGDRFLSASRAIEDLLDLIAAARMAAERGHEAGARICLKAFAGFLRTELADPVQELREPLAGVADHIITIRRPGGRGVLLKTSAHEAAMDLGMLVANEEWPDDKPLPLDWLRWLDDHTRALPPLITRERALLLREANRHPPPRPAGEPPSLLEQALAELTPHQGKILRFLWDKKTASFARLRSIPGAWRDRNHTSDRAIEGKLKDMRQRLENCDNRSLSTISISISTAGERATITRPSE
jgi:hypothetical protein